MARHSKSTLVPLRSLALVSLLAGCAGPAKIVRNQRSEADFGAYRTYGFVASPAEHDRIETTLAQALRSAASHEMESRDYAPADDPDLGLRFLLYSWEAKDARPTAVPIYAYRPRDEFTGTTGYETKAVRESRAALLLQVIDNRSGQVVWEAARISRSTPADREASSADAAIAELFRSYPFVAGSDVPAAAPSGTTAFDEYRPRAKGGDASAQFLVGAMYYGGYGTPEDHGRAAEWYRRSADQGYGPAMLHLALMTLTGQGVARDDARARHWLQQAAELELPAAQYSLGSLCRSGRGGPRDDAKAAHWIRRAADGGYAAAQSDLALMYLQGRGVLQDDEKALHWYTRAAEQGFAHAQARLGMMHEHGRGTSRDTERAYEWYALAAENGDEDAARQRERLGRSIPPGRRAQAQQRARSLASGR